MSDEIFISSLVVQTKPENFDSVCCALRGIPDTHFGCVERTVGKVIVLLETDTSKRIQNWISRAQNVAGVLSVSMIYQHAEPASDLHEVVA